MDNDPLRDLNNYLQGHPRGNLTTYLSWALTYEGPDHQRIHSATVGFNGRDIGFGRGFSKGLAKREAAVRALQSLGSIPIETLLDHAPGPLQQSQGSDSQSESQASSPESQTIPQGVREYLSRHPGGSLIPWFSWSVSKTGPDHQRIYRTIAQFDGSEIGHGESLYTGGSNGIAALQAIKYFHDNPQPPPPPHPQQGTIYNMRERTMYWDYIFNYQDQGSRSEPRLPVATFAVPNAPQLEGGEFPPTPAWSPNNLPPLEIGDNREACRRVQRMTITRLNYDVLLNIFDCCRLSDNTTDESGDGWNLERWWYKLIQVCRVWRDIILGHPTCLELHLVCTYGTPVEAMLSHSPPFPLIIYYPGKHGAIKTMSDEDKRGAIFALRQRKRVHRVHIAAPAASLHDLVGSMDDEYPILQRLVIRSQDEPSPDHDHDHNLSRNRNPNDAATVMLHENLRTPMMHRLTLSNVALPASLRLLSSAGADLASLGLFSFPASPRDFHLAQFTTQLGLLSHLQMLTIYFSAAIPNREITRGLRGMPMTTRIALPCLRILAYRGGSAYLEGILARLDAPNLRTLNVEFFNQLTFPLPSLCMCMRTIDALAFRSIALYFDENFASLIVDPLDKHAGGPGDSGGSDHDGGGGTQPLHIQISGKALDWQVFSISQICSALAPLLSQTEILTLGFYKDSPDPDHAAAGAVGAVDGEAVAELQGDEVAVNRAQWLALLRVFAGVKMLQLAGQLVGGLFRALQLHQDAGNDNSNDNGEAGDEDNGNGEGGGAVTPEILPALQKLVPRGWGHRDEVFSSFVAARGAAGYPVRLLRNRW